MKSAALEAKIARNIALLVDDPDDGSVTAADLVDWLGLSAPRIHALAREGRIPRRADGRFDLRAAVRGYAESLRLKSGTSALAQNPELNTEKVRLAREQADKLALANSAARGEMLDAREVAQEWRGVVTDLRAALLAVPSRVAARLGLDRAATLALDREIRDAMEAIARDR